MPNSFEEEAKHLPTHVAVCAQRYRGIERQLQEMRRLLISCILLLATGLATFLIDLAISHFS